MQNPCDYLNAFALAKAKYKRTAVQAAQENMIPYRSENGKWIPSPFDGNSWWTGGFWPGIMYLFYAESRDDFFLTEARRVQNLLTHEFRTFHDLHHDVGFMYLLSCGADYKLTQDAQALNDTLHAASLLMGRFNPAGFIRAWNGEDQKGYAIIDCMMNLSLLFWASRITGDPRFAKVAEIHIETVIRTFIRENGSFRHIVELDPDTGKFICEHGGQGYAEGTSWSRGQAWGLYGFTLAAINTGNKHYLEIAEKAAAYFISNIREDGLTDCDFCQPETPERLDNIAGAVAACGLLELEKLTQNATYGENARKLVDGLLTHCCDFGELYCGLLTHCTASYHDDLAGVHTNIVYGDFFLIEALAKLNGTDPMLWV